MLKMDKLNEATEIILNKGVDGVQDASRIIGREAALAIVIMYLQNKQSPHLDDHSCMLRRSGLLDVICYSPRFGRGLVFAENGMLLYVIDINDMYGPKRSQIFQLEIWMLGLNDKVVIPAGIYPYRAAYDMMLRDHGEFLKNCQGVLPEED